MNEADLRWYLRGYIIGAIEFGLALGIDRSQVPFLDVRLPDGLEEWAQSPDLIRIVREEAAKVVPFYGKIRSFER